METYAVDVWTVFGWIQVSVVAESRVDVYARVFANEVIPKLDPPPSTLGLTAQEFSSRVRICGQYCTPIGAMEVLAD